MRWPRIVAYAAFSTGLLLSCIAYAQQTVIFGFERSWVEAKADLKAYEDVFFRNIDLRDLHLKVHDIDGELVKDRFSADAMQQIAFAIFRSFADPLDGVIDVNMEELEAKDLKEKNLLVIDLKVSGTYVVEEERLLMKVIKGSAKPSLALTLEGSVVDGATDRALATFADTKDIVDLSDTPFENAEDLEKLSAALDQWASYLKDFLWKKRK